MENVNKKVEKEAGENETNEAGYRFKMGHRKKAIQAVENSFVIMDRLDPSDNTTSTPPKRKFKYGRCKSDIDCYMEYRKKAKEAENKLKNEANKDNQIKDQSEETETDTVRSSNIKCELCQSRFLNEGKIGLFKPVLG